MSAKELLNARQRKYYAENKAKLTEQRRIRRENEKKYVLETTWIENVICKKCNKALEKHTMAEHLDINHYVHKCDGGHERSDEVLITDGNVAFFYKKYEKMPDGFWRIPLFENGKQKC
jgi:DNA-binding GntR family transcriptional regulator